MMCGLSFCQLTIQTPTVPEDRKGHLAALPHPTTFQLSDRAFEELAERVAGYITAEPDQYWNDLCHNETTVRQQQRARDETKEQPKSHCGQHHTPYTAAFVVDHSSCDDWSLCVCSAPSRRYYITRSFVFDKVERVEAVLERLRKLREADSAAAKTERTSGDVNDGLSEGVKEPEEKKMRLHDAG